jgi:hypothetical protein
MKRIVPAILIFLYSIITQAQESRIENTRARFSVTNDSLIVNYNLTGKRKGFDIKLNVNDREGQPFLLKNVFGDIGNGIRPGTDKTIIWNIKADEADVYGKQLQVKVTGNVFEPLNKKSWVIGLYLTAGVCAATGTYAQIRAKQIYRGYPSAVFTDEAEELRNKVERMHLIRNITFGAAGGFAIAGFVAHIKHIQKKKAVEISYLPLNNGGLLGLNVKF